MHDNLLFIYCRCGINNFASRRECFKCQAARPEGAGPPKREPRPGDWDCPE